MMLLKVENLRSSFFLDNGELKAVDDISFGIEKKETLAIVGESGCGKTVVAHSVLNLLSLPGKIIGGCINFSGKDLLKMEKDRLSEIRGNKIGVVFQEPGASLNPVFTIGQQLREVLKRHTNLSSKEIQTRSVSLLGDMGFKEPEKWMSAYPHQLSGGMQQRAAIALAMNTHPDLLIADEPTTALDVTVQAEIIDLLKYIKEEHKMAMLLISHDLGVVAELADKVMVMYAGKQLEQGPLEDIFKNPLHPYTKGLLKAASGMEALKRDFLAGIPGSVPDLMSLPDGCVFHPRCEEKEAVCTVSVPGIISISGNRLCACHLVK